MIIARNTGGIAATNAYLIGDAEAKQAVIFDAPDNTIAPLLDAAVEHRLDVIGLWLTHGHFDHIADHLEITRRFPNAKVLIHKLDEPRLQQPNSQGFELPFTIAPRSGDAYVEDGQTLSIGNIRVEVIHTPGHAPGHVMYYLPDEKILIGGDLIIGGSIGRTDLPDSDHAALERSIRRVMQLPPETRLLPGHGDVSTLELEKLTNPFVQEALRTRE